MVAQATLTIRIAKPEKTVETPGSSTNNSSSGSTDSTTNNTNGSTNSSSTGTP